MPMEGVMTRTKNERMELQRQAGARNGRADQARQARLILLRSEGLTWAQIRAKLDCGDSYIACWSTRFAPIGWRGCLPVTRGARATK